MTDSKHKYNEAIQMNTKYYLFILVLLSPTSSFAAGGLDVTKGSALLPACKILIDALEGKIPKPKTLQESTEGTAKTMKAGFCNYYVRGFIAGHQMTAAGGSRILSADKKYNEGLQDKLSMFCLPKNIEINQIIRAIVKTLEESPELVHQQSKIIVPVALNLAFPCS